MLVTCSKAYVYTCNHTHLYTCERVDVVIDVTPPLFTGQEAIIGMVGGFDTHGSQQHLKGWLHQLFMVCHWWFLNVDL